MVKVINEVYYSSRFNKSFQKISPRIKKKFFSLEKDFRKDCYAIQLKTHRLKGNYKDYCSFSVTYSYRVVFEFYKDGVLLVDIGTHAIYK